MSKIKKIPLNLTFIHPAKHKQGLLSHTFSDEEPSDVSSPSLPSSHGFRLLGFFFLLLMTIAAPRRSASGILPSAAGKQVNGSDV